MGSEGCQQKEEVSLSKRSMVDENGATEAMKGVTQKSRACVTGPGEYHARKLSSCRARSGFGSPFSS